MGHAVLLVKGILVVECHGCGTLKWVMLARGPYLRGYSWERLSEGIWEEREMVMEMNA